jgi:quercetin dioxygenase-like cupin family protein
MECKLIKGNALQFGTYGFEHINLPPERPDYWDTKVKVAKIVESTSTTQGRFGVTLEVAAPCKPFKHKFAGYEEVVYIVSGGPLRIGYKGQTFEAVAGDFLISPMGEEIIWEVVNEVTYITCHTPPVDIIIKEREKKYGFKK